MTIDSIGEGYTIKEAAEALGVSEMTVRRHIKQGKLKARTVAGKFGDEYRIELSADHLTPSRGKPEQDSQALINRLEQLSQEAGYWRARAEIAEGRMRLLEAPKVDRRGWWRRLFQNKRG